MLWEGASRHESEPETSLAANANLVVRSGAANKKVEVAAVVKDEQLSRYADVVLRDGAMGWPTSAVLRSMPVADIYDLHDVVLTADLSHAASETWIAANPHKAMQIRDLLGTLSWPQRRELALVYIEEANRRETAERERRMERLTWSATIVSAVALVVSLVALLLAP
jgi:hypothetical protein